MPTWSKGAAIIMNSSVRVLVAGFTGGRYRNVLADLADLGHFQPSQFRLAG